MEQTLNSLCGAQTQLNSSGQFFQSLCNLLDTHQRHVPDAALNPAIVRPVQPHLSVASFRIAEQTKLVSVEDLAAAKGQFYFAKRTPDGLAKARDYFTQAAVRDPQYAQAYVGAANYWAVVSEYAPIQKSECMPKLKEAAEKALSLNEKLPEVHEALSQYYISEWKWADWEREHRRALEHDPNFAAAHHWFGLELSWIGRSDEAITHSRRAVELDPLNLKFNDNLGQVLVNARHDDEGLTQLNKTIEMDPNFAGTYGDLSTLYRY